MIRQFFEKQRIDVMWKTFFYITTFMRNKVESRLILLIFLPDDRLIVNQLTFCIFKFVVYKFI